MRQVIILFFVAVSLFIMTVKAANGNETERPLITNPIVTDIQDNETTVINDDSTVESESQEDSETEEIDFDEPEMPLE
jgi:hypothetical protein